MAITFEVDGLFSKLSRLVDFRNRGLFTDTEFAKNFPDGNPLWRVEHQCRLTKGANYTVAVYDVMDHVDGFLAAIAARDRELNNPL